MGYWDVKQNLEHLYSQETTKVKKCMISAERRGWSSLRWTMALHFFEKKWQSAIEKKSIFFVRQRNPRRKLENKNRIEKREIIGKVKKLFYSICPSELTLLQNKHSKWINPAINYFGYAKQKGGNPEATFHPLTPPPYINVN